MDFARAPRKRIRISLIPLIDVSIFLLIFFMLAGSVQRFEVVAIDPPVAQSGKLTDEGHVVILLGRHEEIILGDEMLNLPELQQRLLPLLKDNPGKVITVKADAALAASRAIEVMDAIKASGGRNLSIETQSRAMAYGE